MSRKLFTIIVVALVVFSLGAFGYYWYSTHKSASGGDAATGTTGSAFDLFPEGSSVNPPANNPSNSQNAENGGTQSGAVAPAPESIKKVMKVSDGPVAGAAFITLERPLTEAELADFGGDPKTAKTTEQTLAVRYMKIQNGNIYDKYVGRTDAEMRVTNTTIPRVHDAIFGKDGASVVFRYYNDKTAQIDTYTASIKRDDPKAPGVVSGSFLPFGITSIAISPDKTKLVYLYPFSGRTIGTVSDMNGLNKKQVSDTAFDDWLVDWPSADTLIFNTKPTGAYGGYLYSINLKSGSSVFNRILGNMNGLTSLSNNSGSKILYGKSVNGQPKLYLYDSVKKTTTDTSLFGMPEKCAWSKDSITLYCAIPNSPAPALYPDVWYQGAMSFNDSLWKLNTQTGTYTLVSNLSEETGGVIDATNLALDSTEKYIVFINKNDQSLWTLGL